MIDDKKLQQFLGKMLVDLGGAISLPLVRIGVRLGLYKAMDGSGPMTSVEFADKANISERYAREWLAQNAASGYLSYDPSSRRFELPPEQAMVFANEESPFFLGGGFDAVAAVYQTQPLIEAAFKSGGGVDWGDHDGCLFCVGWCDAATALFREYCAKLAARFGWRRKQTGTGREGRRYRLRHRPVHLHHGQGFPKLNLCWLRFPPTFHRARYRLRADKRRREHPVRGGQGKRFPCEGSRPGDML